MAFEEKVETPAGGFIFINHSAKRLRTIKDKSHRANINQHVQRVWLRNQKPKETKVLGQSSRYHRRPSHLDETSRLEADPNHGAYPTPPPQLAPYKTSQLIRFRTISQEHPRSRKGMPPRLPFAAFNILTHGNSDPFNTLAIPMDATVSHLLQYSKEVMIPSVYSMEVRSTSPSLGIAKAWEHVTLAFEDECAISAYLAISATSLARVAPSSDLIRLALKYSNQSSALLRQRIANSKNNIDPRLYIIVLWLSANALATGDITAGMVHANTLCYLVKQGGGIAAVEPFQRENILQFDVQFAMMCLRKPFFDAKDYAPGSFDTAWLYDPNAVAIPSLSNTLHPNPPLTSSITSLELISTLTTLRTLHSVYMFTLSHSIPGTSPILRWMYLQKHAVEAQLLEYCCNLIYSPATPTSSTASISTPPNSDAEVEYTSLLPPLCVAALYWTAMAVGYSKQKIHACSTLLLHLRTLLSSIPSTFSTPAQQFPTNPNAPLRLWILYVGSLAEQALGPEQVPCEWTNWCTRRFVQQARGMGVRSAARARAILQGVLFAERMHHTSTGEGQTPWGREDVLVEGGDVQQEGGFESWWERVESLFRNAGADAAEERSP